MPVLRPVCRILLLALLGIPVPQFVEAPARAQESGASSCSVAADPAWSAQEQWAWSQICAGRVADLSHRFGQSDDPAAAASWPPERQLGVDFLRTVLLRDPWRSAVPADGLRIVGARFGEAIDLVNAGIGREVALERSYFAGDVRLRGSTVPHGLSFAGSRFGGLLDLGKAVVEGEADLQGVAANDLNLAGARIGTNLNLNGLAIAASFNLEALQVGRNLTLRKKPQIPGGWLLAADIGGDFFIEGAAIAGPLMLEDLKLGSDLLIYGSRLGTLNLSGAGLGGALRIRHSLFEGAVAMREAQIGKSLIVEGQTGFAGPLQLTSTTIAGDLVIANSAAAADLGLGSLQVAGSLVLGRKARFAGHVDATFVKVGTNLDLTEGQFTSVDLTGTAVGAEIRLASRDVPNVRWLEPAKLTLRNVSAGALQDLPEAWPREVDLEGFTYLRLGGFQAGAAVAVAKRDVRLFIEWLAKQPDYSPQPYTQLAGVLKQSGNGEKAKQILYAGKQREWRDAAGTDKVWLTLNWLFTGFGYYPEISGLWALLFVVVGTFVFSRSKAPEMARYTLGDRIIYSLDMLLPIITLRQAHDKFDLVSSAKYYLYVHKVMGYVLITFLVLALTQPRG